MNQTKSLMKSMPLMALLAILFSVFELWFVTWKVAGTTFFSSQIYVAGTSLATEASLCICLHKYMCLRLMLDFCDNILAHKRNCCGLNSACQLWCLSFRFVRD